MGRVNTVDARAQFSEIIDQDRGGFSPKSELR